MNFLKKGLSTLTEGIELEKLKSQRSSLRNDIKEIEKKISAFNDQIHLKSNLTKYLSDNNNAISILQEQRAALIQQTNGIIQQHLPKDSQDNQDNIKTATPLESTLQKLNNIINKNADDIKSLIKNRDDLQDVNDELNKISVDVGKYQEEINQKTIRINEINERLRVIRGLN